LAYRQIGWFGCNLAGIDGVDWLVGAVFLNDFGAPQGIDGYV
jgi:hypothetical protein